MLEGGGPIGSLDRFLSRNYVITSGPFVGSLVMLGSCTLLIMALHER